MTYFRNMFLHKNNFQALILSEKYHCYCNLHSSGYFQTNKRPKLGIKDKEQNLKARTDFDLFMSKKFDQGVWGHSKKVLAFHGPGSKIVNFVSGPKNVEVFFLFFVQIFIDLDNKIRLCFC